MRDRIFGFPLIGRNVSAEWAVNHVVLVGDCVHVLHNATDRKEDEGGKVGAIV